MTKEEIFNLLNMNGVITDCDCEGDVWVNINNTESHFCNFCMTIGDLVYLDPRDVNVKKELDEVTVSDILDFVYIVKNL